MKHSISICFLLVLLEVLAQTYLPAIWNKDISALLYLFVGIAIGVFPLITKRPQLETRAKAKSASRIIPGVTFLILSIATIYLGLQVIRAQPLDYTFADMLPIIKIMGERWLVGAEVYAIIPEIWGGMQPIYLPMMWLSYVPMIVLDLDIRIVNILFMLMVAALVLRPWQALQREKVYSFVRALLLLVILFSYVFYTYTTFITISEEPIVVGFYALLGYAIYRQKTRWIIFALAACFLSRYVLVFWAVCYIGYMFIFEDRKRSIYLMAGTGLLAVLLLLVSQGIYELELFYALKDAYLDSFQNPDLAWRTQNTISKNIGLARFVPFEHLLTLHKSVFWGSVLLPLLLYAWYHFRLRKRPVSFALFAICSLKLCLVFFFNFNALPYSYLFYTSTILSLIIWSLHYADRKEWTDVPS